MAARPKQEQTLDAYCSALDRLLFAYASDPGEEKPVRSRLEAAKAAILKLLSGRRAVEIKYACRCFTNKGDLFK